MPTTHDGDQFSHITTMTHPTYTARDIASLIDNDPIMASQIKEFIRTERLLDCLDILKEIPSSTMRNELLERDELCNKETEKS